MTKFNSDIDIDFGDRDKILDIIEYTHAAMQHMDKPRRHNTGIHVTEIPYDPVHNMSALDYTEAEERGYMKLDFLNVHVYKNVRDEQHLVELMREPDWSKLQDSDFVGKLIHLNGHFNELSSMSEPVNSIPRLAMFIALIRPGKKHLIGKSWKEISQTIWDAGNEGYHFKRSHSIAYAHLVVVHMNLLTDGIITPVLSM